MMTHHPCCNRPLWSSPLKQHFSLAWTPSWPGTSIKTSSSLSAPLFHLFRNFWNFIVIFHNCKHLTKSSNQLGQLSFWPESSVTSGHTTSHVMHFFSFLWTLSPLSHLPPAQNSFLWLMPTTEWVDGLRLQRARAGGGDAQNDSPPHQP